MNEMIDHMDLYRDTCFRCSKIITQRYSTSFTLGIKTLHKRYHMPIYGIYGYVRAADEIVDTFHDYDKRELFSRFRAETYLAIEEGISINPVLQAFQSVVRGYDIEMELINAFLDSMEMDLEHKNYDPDLYDQYIYGSAEVVGLMCLRVFCEGDKEKYKKLQAPAKSLGSAFQKVNFLRDMQSDFHDRGRVYFPGVDFGDFNEDTKARIEEDIRKDFELAYQGIVRLPEGARRGVYLAYVYYKRLFEKICKVPVTRIMHERIRVPNNQKIALLVKSIFQHELNFL